MSPQANPIKRLLLWLAGAPAEPEPAAAAVSLAAEPEPTRSLEPDNPPAVEPELSPPLETAAEPLEPGNSPSAAASGPTPTAANLAPTELQPMTNDPVNDAGAYGVRVVAADLPAGASYWRAVRVHHLTPAENGGRHHLFLDALDEAGGRVIGAQARVTWPGDAQTITVEKPVGEPGANFPLWKWQIVAVEMLGLPSDRVENLHTGHPDEPPGLDNTLFHHSFAVDFQRSVKAVAGSQPGGDKPLARYVLFGPPASSRTAVYLEAARAFLLAQQPAMGYRAEEASHAAQVVIVGELQDISQATEDALRQAGCQVQRIQGTPEQVAAALLR
jgi:hypothetical protein